MNFYLKGIFVINNIADRFINVDKFEVGINLVGMTNKVILLMTFYLYLYKTFKYFAVDLRLVLSLF